MADLEFLVLELQGLTDEYTIDFINKVVKFKGNEEFVRLRVAHLEKVKGEVTLYADLVNKFNDTNAYALHNLCPYEGKFYPRLARLVRTLINVFKLDHNSLLLDSFNGSGTTTHEASLMGIKSVGIDITPMGTILSELKWAVGYVIERLPEGMTRLVLPFFWGGSIEIAGAKELGIKAIGFEIFDVLVNYWKVQIENPEKLYQEFIVSKFTKEVYNRVKQELRGHWKGEIKLPPITLSAFYYFNHNLSYGPGFLGWMSSVYANEKIYHGLLERVKNFNVKNIKIEKAILIQ
ncbi:MAG: site-specific DNA-methyltransferase [Brevinematales bacterium]|nr:site-specific DNA-methyltransferase [Brevinematales bacterium]